ncbi:hypothetical protein [Candidatus Odyssella thessalonicensis]|uniref:hypothetical protein n=1 Tax=Candidatus Odyssella thessalonicensis TaxID=84647 RepID=UPI0002F2D116|nr:hypothetical protein [Candidatus Odyssella thessalonicensis]
MESLSHLLWLNGSDPVIWQRLEHRLEQLRKSSEIEGFPYNSDAADLGEAPGLPSLLELPEEILQNIFWKLDYIGFKNLEDTCHTLRSIKFNEALGKSLAARDRMIITHYWSHVEQPQLRYELNRFGVKALGAYPNLPLIKFDMAYGHHFGSFGEWGGDAPLEKFDGVEVTFVTAQDRKLQLTTSARFIAKSNALHYLQMNESKLPPLEEEDSEAKATEACLENGEPEEDVTANSYKDIVTGTRNYLRFSYNDFPIKVLFKLLSGHAGMNPPANFGWIVWSNCDSNITKWHPNYPQFGKELKAEDTILTELFSKEVQPVNL